MTRFQPRDEHSRDDMLRPREDMLRRFGLESATAWSWAALIAASLIAFGVTHGTEYRQLGVAILLSSATLLALLLLFEMLWQLLLALFELEQSDKFRR